VKGFELADLPEETPPALAFLGVLPCDLAAIKTQDRILMGDKVVDPLYRARRERTLLICVKCTRAGGTCFCASMGTGPDVQEGFDLALTEVLEDGEHYFVAESGSVRGAALLARLSAPEASAEEQSRARQLVTQAAGKMGRTLETRGLRELLQDNFEHPRWEAVARRCLTCGNCTMVCPTCFCTTVEDTTDLAGRHAERRRKWDVCYTLDFTYLYGGHVRSTTKARYRQWLTHKLSTWFDQFGMSGCVGCGRCITWCPVGIDLTEEARAIRQNRSAPGESVSMRG
jgi:ferredoxin